MSVYMLQFHDIPVYYFMLSDPSGMNWEQLGVPIQSIIPEKRMKKP